MGTGAVREGPGRVTWGGLIRYYAAAAARSAADTGFRFLVEEEGSRFLFWSGPDPLFGISGGEAGPSPAGVAGEMETLARLAELAGESLCFGFPLVIDGEGRFLPLLWLPVRQSQSRDGKPLAGRWVGGSWEFNLALLGGSEAPAVWDLVGSVRRTLEPGVEPGPASAAAFAAAVTVLASQIGLEIREPIRPGRWSAPVTRRAERPAAGVYNQALLFRAFAPDLPLWLWREWERLAEREPPRSWARALSPGLEAGADRNGDGDGLAEDRATPLQLLFHAFTPGEREALAKGLSDAEACGSAALHFPQGDGEIEAAFHLLINAWRAGRKVLVVAPTAREIEPLVQLLRAVYPGPFFGWWSDTKGNRATVATIRWMVRSRSSTRPKSTKNSLQEGNRGHREELEKAWQGVRQAEDAVSRATSAGERAVAIRRELDRAARSLAPALEELARRIAGGKGDGTGRPAGSWARLAEQVGELVAEGERIAGGRWRWTERLWPWRRTERLTGRLELRLRALLNGAGLNSGDWLLISEPHAPAALLQSLRQVENALRYAELQVQYLQWKEAAGEGPWEAPSSLPHRLDEALAALTGVSTRLVQEQREAEVGAWSAEMVARLELWIRLEAEIRASRPGSAAAAELERVLAELFPGVLEALPVWFFPIREASFPLPDRPDLFDLALILRAERIPLAVALPFACRARSTLVLGDASEEAMRLAEEKQFAPEARALEQDAAATQGLWGLDYLRHAWPVSALRWLKEGDSLLHIARAPVLRRPCRRVGQLANRLFHGATLHPVGGPGGAVAWVEARGQVIVPETGSAFNLEEAEAVVAAVRERLAATGGQPARVAIVTPFRRQKELLMRKLLAALPSLPGDDPGGPLVRVLLPPEALHGTEEWPTVIFSPVISRGAPEAALCYLEEHPEFLYAAIARAREEFVVVGDPEMVASLGGTWDDLARLLSRAEGLRAETESMLARSGSALPARPDLAPAEVAATAEAETVEEGPYPAGREGLFTLYRELLLRRSGWRGRRTLAGIRVEDETEAAPAGARPSAESV